MTTHPAKWSQAVLDAIGDVCFELLPDGAAIFDPFAGEGVPRLAEAIGQPVTGIELEPEWAEKGGDTTIVGNALALPFDPASMDAMITSPAYANRMADSHDAKDDCKACNGRGFVAHAPSDGPRPVEKCRACDGRGLSKRNTYRHALGRMPTEGSSTTMQWGEPYRQLHEKAWREAARVLKPGGLVILNVSNHIRGGREKHVAEWHLNCWLLLGARVHHVRRVPTPRLGFGQNGDARVDGELILVLHTPPA